MNELTGNNALSGQQEKAPGFVGRAGVAMRTPSPTASSPSLSSPDFLLTDENYTAAERAGMASQALTVPLSGTIRGGPVDFPTETIGSPVGRVEAGYRDVTSECEWCEWDGDACLYHKDANVLGDVPITAERGYRLRKVPIQIDGMPQYAFIIERREP